MKPINRSFLVMLSVFITVLMSCKEQESSRQWTINDLEYLETPGLSVLAFHNYYPVGKQGGIELIHHGERIATNGFIRMESTGGRRFQDPDSAKREVDLQGLSIKSRVDHEEFNFSYSVSVRPEEDVLKLTVDLDAPLPEEWEGKISFALEFYPSLYIGKSFQIDQYFGIIPLQAYGPMQAGGNGRIRAASLGTGKSITLAGEDPLRKITVESLQGSLELADERNYAGRGWLILSTEIPFGVTEKAVEWQISPNLLPGWKREPMIAISQVGYHPLQQKRAIIELDPKMEKANNAYLHRIQGAEGLKRVYSAMPEDWGSFLRYDYVIFDFTPVTEPGMYMVQYGDQYTHPFSIHQEVFRKGVWQPTLEFYFPVQMCHMKVTDRAAIWHGACHLDDALQAPLAIEHIDSYRQYASAETRYTPMTTIPYLNQGGWHDAGDDDLAAGSQASTTHYLVLANEIADIQPDQTTVDYKDLSVRIRQPDGIPDMIQQVKHGAINLLSGYRSSGHSFAGIIANREGRNKTGDWASQTDQLFYDKGMPSGQKTTTHSGVPDDRWAFTNRDTGLEYQVAAALAAASRALNGFDDNLSQECLETAIKTWHYEQSNEPVKQPNAYVPRNTDLEEILATVELAYTTEDEEYLSHLVSLLPKVKNNMGRAAWGIARVVDQIKDEAFKSEFMTALAEYKSSLDAELQANPFGVPWEPRIWGVGWNIQRFALEHYYLVEKYPELFDRELVLRVVNYVLGCHPGSNVSLVSGVGARSVTIAFGVYRDWWNYIPGGMVSGTSLIRPDFPELKETTPYLWQQSEYVMPGAGSYIFCILAADQLLSR